MAGAHEHSAPVGLRVVNAVGDRQAVGIRAKIMILYQDGCAIPLGASVFEVANLFLLLRIDTDDGQALVDKSFSLRPDVKELLMAICLRFTRSLNFSFWSRRPTVFLLTVIPVGDHQKT